MAYTRIAPLSGTQGPQGPGLTTMAVTKAADLNVASTGTSLVSDPELTMNLTPGTWFVTLRTIVSGGSGVTSMTANLWTTGGTVSTFGFTTTQGGGSTNYPFNTNNANATISGATGAIFQATILGTVQVTATTALGVRLRLLATDSTAYNLKAGSFMKAELVGA